MLRPPSLLGAQTSGFVPFGAAGSVHGDLDEPVGTTYTPTTLRGATPAPAVELSPSPTSEKVAWRQAVWAPVASGRVRLVEATVLAATAGYFSLGLVRLVGWL